MNISSAIIHTTAGGISAIESNLRALSGVEVHASSGDGKLVISIESPSDRETADIFEAIQHLDGVLSASLVYSHFETDPDDEL